MAVNNMRALVGNPTVLRRFKEFPEEERLQKLETLNPDFANANENVKSMVMSKIMSTPVKGENDLPITWEKIPMTALRNIPSSTVQMGKDIWSAVRHPVATEEAMENIVIGAAQKLWPGKQATEQHFDAVVTFFKERYGSVAGLKKTMATDPVGFLGDIAGLAGMFGVAAKAASASRALKATQTGKILQKVATGAQNLSTGFDTPQKLVKGVGNVIKGKKPVNTLTKSALKLPKNIPLDRGDELIEVFLRNNYKLDRKTLARIGNETKANQAIITKQVNKLTKQGVKVRTSDIVNSIDELSKSVKEFSLSTDQTRNLKLLDKMKLELLENNAEFLTPNQIQRSKILFSKDYVPDTRSRVGAMKARTREKLRSESMAVIEKIYPESKALNHTDGLKIELEKIIESRIKDMEKAATTKGKGLMTGGIATAVTGGILGGLVGGSATAAAAGVIGGVTFTATSLVVGKIIADPRINITIAKILKKVDSARKAVGTPVTAAAPAGNILFQTGRASEEQGNFIPSQGLLSNE